MKIKIYGEHCIKSIKDSWMALEKGSDMTIFQSYEWNEILLYQYNHQYIRRLYRKIRYVCLSDENNIIKVIAPLRIKKIIKKGKIIREIELFGADSFSDYVNFIYNDVNETYFTEIMSFINNKWRKYKIRWNSIPEKSKLGIALSLRYPLDTSYYYKCIYIPIPENGNYINMLSKSTRQNYRTAINRMKREGLEFTWRIFDYNIDENLIDKLMDINLERTIEKNGDEFQKLGRKMVEYINLKFGNIVRRMMSYSNHSWTLVSYLNDDEAGFLTGLRTEDTVYVMMNKVRPKYTFYSPMIVAIIDYIDSLNMGVDKIKIVDFGRGTEDYKYKLGGKEVSLIKYERR